VTFFVNDKEFWQQHYERQFQTALVAIMRACKVEQIHVSHSDLMNPATVDTRDTPDGGRFFRITDTFKLC
jgi:hypothetical protein